MNTTQRQQNVEMSWLRNINKDGPQFSQQVNVRSIANRFSSFLSKRLKKSLGSPLNALDIESLASEFANHLASSDKFIELVKTEAFLSELKLYVADKVLFNALKTSGKGLIASDYVAKRLAEIQVYRDKKPAKFKKLNSTIKAIKSALAKNGILFEQIKPEQRQALERVLLKIITENTSSIHGGAI